MSIFRSRKDDEYAMIYGDKPIDISKLHKDKSESLYQIRYGLFFLSIFCFARKTRSFMERR